MFGRCDDRKSTNSIRNKGSIKQLVQGLPTEEYGISFFLFVINCSSKMKLKICIKAEIAE